MRPLFPLFLMGLASLASGCATLSGDAHSDPLARRTAAYLLFDRTPSNTAFPVRLNAYRGVQYLLRSAEPEQIFVGDAITRDSGAVASYALSGVFPLRDSQTTDPMWNDAVEPVIQQIEVQARALLDLAEKGGVITDARPATRKVPAGTAILDALWAPAQFFRGVQGKKTTTRQVWIFSDAIEQSRWDFTSENLTPGRIQAILHAERVHGHLPDLTGVELHFVGAGAMPYSLVESGRVETLSAARLQQIHNFWCAYAAATHAQLPPDGYVPVLRDWSAPDPAEVAEKANP